MHNCKKNERTMYYALYTGKEQIVDSNGNSTFEYKSSYSVPVQFKASLSDGKSTAEEQPFGYDVKYDRVISTCDTSLPIDENSIIWVKNTPTYNQDGSVNSSSADYKVAALPLDGLNTLRIAIKKVSNAVVEQTNTNDNQGGNDGNNDDDSGF